MTEMTGGQALIRSLHAYGVDTIFGLPGVQLDNIFDALYHEQDTVRVLHTRHEQSTAYMAFGYAQATGKVGVCLVVPGPGVLNAAGALSTAWACNSPVLCLTGQIFDHQAGLGIGALHEIPDQLGMMSHVSKWVSSIDKPEDAPGIVDEAMRHLTTGRPRPVVLDMSPNTMGKLADVAISGPKDFANATKLDDDAIKQAAKILGEAEYPVLFVGTGAIDAGEAIKELADALQAPVVMTPAARGTLSDRHPLALSLLGGHRIWDKPDVVLAVGTRFERPALDWGIDGMKIVRVDIDPEEITRVNTPDVGIVSDATTALTAIANALPAVNKKRESREEEILQLREALNDELWEVGQPQAALMQVIREEMDDDGIFVGDVTQMAVFADMALPLYEPRQLISSGFQGTLGYGFATSLGVKVGQPDKPVVSVSGDGGFLYTMPELATAKQHNINIVAMVFDDNAYGNVKALQRANYGGREIASTLENPDYVKLADSFGIAGRRAESPEELREALKEGFSLNEPMLIGYPTAPMPMLRGMNRGKKRG